MRRGGAKSFVDDLGWSRGVVLSRAATLLRSIETLPCDSKICSLLDEHTSLSVLGFFGPFFATGCFFLLLVVYEARCTWVRFSPQVKTTNTHEHLCWCKVGIFRLLAPLLVLHLQRRREGRTNIQPTKQPSKPNSSGEIIFSFMLLCYARLNVALNPSPLDQASDVLTIKLSLSSPPPPPPPSTDGQLIFQNFTSKLYPINWQLYLLLCVPIITLTSFLHMKSWNIQFKNEVGSEMIFNLHHPFHFYSFLTGSSIVCILTNLT